MIVVKVELWSAITGKKTELARMHIANDASGKNGRNNYIARTFRGRSTKALDKLSPSREGTVNKYPSKSIHIWNLVRKALANMEYTDE